MKSRKLKVLIWIISLATGATFLPPILCWVLAVFHHPVPELVILTDGDWITAISIIIPAFLGADTWEKHIATKSLDLPQNPNANTIGKNKQADDAEKQAIQDKLKHE